MRSARPKPLHMLCGRPLVRYVLDALADSTRPTGPWSSSGHGAERGDQDAAGGPRPGPARVRRAARASGAPATPWRWASPACPTTTSTSTPTTATSLVLPGDTPLLRPETARRAGPRAPPVGRGLHRAHRPAWTTPPATGASSATRTAGCGASSSTATPTPTERAIDEINTGIYVFRRSLLAPALRRLTPENAQGELYVTDVVAGAGRGRSPGRVAGGRRPDETQGVNDRAQLAAAEAELRRRTNARWMREGVTMVDPGRHLHRHRRSMLAHRRHPVPRHGAAGRARSSARAPRSAPTPAWSTPGSARGPRSTRPSATLAEIGDDAVVGPVRRARAGRPRR